jgi:hypothetical protein
MGQNYSFTGKGKKPHVRGMASLRPIALQTEATAGEVQGVLGLALREADF